MGVGDDMSDSTITISRYLVTDHMSHQPLGVAILWHMSPIGGVPSNGVWFEKLDGSRRGNTKVAAIRTALDVSAYARVVAVYEDALFEEFVR